MRHRGKTSSRLSVRTRQDLFGWNNLNRGRCSLATWPRASFRGLVRRLHSADQAGARFLPVDLGQRHVDRASRAVRDRASGQLDWIVQFNTAAVSGIAGPASAARLLPQSGPSSRCSKAWARWAKCWSAPTARRPPWPSAALQADRQIAWFELDSLKQIAAACPTTPSSRSSGRWTTRARTAARPATTSMPPPAWNITTGSRNVVVAVIDSGVDYTDPDLAANIWTNPHAGQDGFAGDLHGYNFVDDNGNPMDDYGHGTFVAGIIGAVGNNGLGVTGVNWNVTIMPLKFLDANGGGYTSDAIRAINYATMERTQYGVNVRVINASWSSSSATRPECGHPGGRQRGHPVRRGGGQHGANNDVTPQYPANYGPAERRLRGRQRLKRPPRRLQRLRGQHGQPGRAGREIYSTLPGSKFGYLSGTSMATPGGHRRGGPGLGGGSNATVAQVRSALLQGVDKFRPWPARSPAAAATSAPSASANA